jgi:hypothetical protein
MDPGEPVGSANAARPAREMVKIWILFMLLTSV